MLVFTLTPVDSIQCRLFRHEQLPLASSGHRAYSCKKATCEDGNVLRISSVSPQQRRQDLQKYGFLTYPRADPEEPASFEFVREIAQTLQPFEEAGSAHTVTVVGRVNAIRSAGTKLLFVDLVEGALSLQVVLDKTKLNADTGFQGNPVKQFKRLIQRGDTISVYGVPYCASAGEKSIKAIAVPKLLSPCLHQVPAGPLGEDSDFAQDRHVHMLMDSSIAQTIMARSQIVTTVQTYFKDRDFTNVQTPILAAAAGGATARPFETAATEFADRKLALRIAPELWLKRLIIGGMHRVYEIGPSFRNEGLDKTHNPEFTTCEFYAVNWTLPRLQNETQNLIATIAERLAHSQISTDAMVDTLKTAGLATVNPSLSLRWPEIDFIPALNKALNRELPDLSAPEARDIILEVFKQKDLPIPSTPTLPRLLDKLCSIYLEPACHDPTWIINTPECLSPLAKSFTHPDLPNQRVAARAELFIRNKEVVNCYEEENSPDEQRRKFVEQQKHASLNEKAHDDEAMKVDEDYLRALEWGLPPTGGWGCGIDRLCMLLLGKEKIGDVLTFGNLRMVAKRAEKRSKT